MLARDYGLERDLLADAVDPNEVPRVQHEGETTYFFLRAPVGQAEHAHTEPLLVALAPHALFTVGRHPFAWLERFREHGSYNTLWRSQLVWRIMLELNARYQSSVTETSRLIRSNLASVQNIRNEDILRLITYEGTLNDYLAALTPAQAMLASVMAGKHMKLYEEDKDLMEDVVLGSGQVVEAAKAALRTAVNLREAYSVIATNNLNRIIKFLTLATVVLTVPMVISGLFGMNVALPLQEHPAAFTMIALISVAVVLSMLFVLARRRLL
jgi:magnesium transporter